MTNNNRPSSPEMPVRPPTPDAALEKSVKAMEASQNVTANVMGEKARMRAEGNKGLINVMDRIGGFISGNRPATRAEAEMRAIDALPDDVADNVAKAQAERAANPGNTNVTRIESRLDQVTSRVNTGEIEQEEERKKKYAKIESRGQQVQPTAEADAAPAQPIRPPEASPVRGPAEVNTDRRGQVTFDAQGNIVRPPETKQQPDMRPIESMQNETGRAGQEAPKVNTPAIEQQQKINRDETKQIEADLAELKTRIEGGERDKKTLAEAARMQQELDKRDAAKEGKRKEEQAALDRIAAANKPERPPEAAPPAPPAPEQTPAPAGTQAEQQAAQPAVELPQGQQAEELRRRAMTELNGLLDTAQQLGQGGEQLANALAPAEKRLREISVATFNPKNNVDRITHDATAQLNIELTHDLEGIRRQSKELQQGDHAAELRSIQTDLQQMTQTTDVAERRRIAQSVIARYNRLDSGIRRATQQQIEAAQRLHTRGHEIASEYNKTVNEIERDRKEQAARTNVETPMPQTVSNLREVSQELTVEANHQHQELMIHNTGLLNEVNLRQDNFVRMVSDLAGGNIEMPAPPAPAAEATPAMPRSNGRGAEAIPATPIATPEPISSSHERQNREPQTLEEAQQLIKQQQEDMRLMAELALNGDKKDKDELSQMATSLLARQLDREGVTNDTDRAKAAEDMAELAKKINWPVLILMILGMGVGGMAMTAKTMATR